MNSTDLSLSKLFVVLFQSYLSKCPCMQELSGMSEAARSLAMPRYRAASRTRKRVKPIFPDLRDKSDSRAIVR
jgi:hypothetical protein